MNVLLVDDEPMMRKMVKMTLQKRGFQVFDSANGIDALAVPLPEGQKIDVLVTDIVMQDIDGWALARSLVERHPDLPVLFTSGYPINFEDERQKRQHYGRCAFLPKPFQPVELVNAILRLAQISSAA